MDITTIEKRVDALLTASAPGVGVGIQAEVLHGTIGVLAALYGPDSSQERQLRELVKVIGGSIPHDDYRIQQIIAAIRGVLTSVKGDIVSGLPGSLRATVTGEVLSDLIKLARTVLDETGEDPKNIAAVLAAAAFEDTMRRLAELNGLSQSEKLADVLTTLKEASVIAGSQVGIAQSYLSFRNRALHAKWSEVDRVSVQSVLSFTEQLLLSKLG